MADGYYEWKINADGSKIKTGSIPNYIKLNNGQSLLLAALYLKITGS